MVSFMKEHKPLSKPTDFLIMAGLFVVALLPRVLTLGKFITADEPYWVVRSLAFATGLLTYDWKLTLQTGHPGVTTMWSGTTGLFLDYLLTQQQAGSFLDFIRTLPSNPEKIDATVLPWMILPIAVLTSSTVIAIFVALRPLDRTVALIASLLWAFEPLYLSHSRVLHHDAPVTVFTCFAVLFFLTALQRHSWKFSLLVGVATGLAFLSKSTGYALLPFMGLTALVELISRRFSLGRLGLGGAVWGIALIVTIFVFWPALWVAPGEVFYTVLNWSSESASIDEVSHTVLPNFSGRTMPHLGLLFYPTGWLLKTSPLILLGLLFLPVWWREEKNSSPARWWAARLLLWAGLFSLMLIIGEKKDGRYLLPIYFALCILAAFGLNKLYQTLNSAFSKIVLSEQLRKQSIQTAFVALLLAVSLPYHPYYLAYYNPLLGGFLFAPYLVKVGWGEGLEQAAAWLNTQPEAASLKVASELGRTFSPFFAGQITNLTPSQPFSADYVLNYRRQIQNNAPYPEFWDYYQAREPVYHLSLAGIDYLWLYKGPPLVTVNRLAFNDSLTLRAYQVNQPIAAPAEPLEVTLIWRTQLPQTEEVSLQLRDEAGKVWAESQPAPVIAPHAPSAVEGYYRLDLPADIPRGLYQLWASLRADAPVLPTPSPTLR